MAANEKKERIILDVAYQPQVRTDNDTHRVMLDVIIALMPALGVAVWEFGWYPLIIMAISVGCSVFFEWGYRKLLHKSSSIGDLSAVVTGLMLACTLPANVMKNASGPWWFMPIVGAFFAIVVVKQLYGGIGKNFMNPALAARALLLASYATYMSGSIYNIDGVSTATPLSYMYGSGTSPFSYEDILFDIVPGCIGELSALALLIGAAYLLIRGVISWRIPTSFIGTVAIICLISGRAGYTNLDWCLHNILTGGLLFGAFFMATDYASSPVTPNGQLLFGAGCGALTILIRYYGGFPEGTTYAILIMNTCSWAIDKLFNRPQFGAVKEGKKA